MGRFDFDDTIRTRDGRHEQRSVGEDPGSLLWIAARIRQVPFPVDEIRDRSAEGRRYRMPGFDLSAAMAFCQEIVRLGVD